jgi:hypothetical protein
MLRHRLMKLLIVPTILLTAVAFAQEKPGVTPMDVLKAAYSLKDGGGYEWRDTGVPEPIVHQGVTILARSEKGTYCCGLTFAVAMKVGQAAGIFNDKSAQQIKRFQREWYGSVAETAEKQMSAAMENLGVGGAVESEDAQPGDFLQFWRTNKSGHSVIFLEWVKEQDQKVGFKYRSSQKSTNGIGDHTEYFDRHRQGKVDPKRMYFARFAGNG